jgi:hypothetical protein
MVAPGRWRVIVLAIGALTGTLLGIVVHAPLASADSSVSAIAAPLPADSSSQEPGQADLSSIACWASGACVAVGHYAGTDSEEGLLLTSTAGTWTPTTAPLPAGFAPASASVYVSKVGCPATGSCIAVGYVSQGTTNDALVETLNGATWTPVVFPLASSFAYIGAGDYAGLACPQAGSCVAVGAYEDATSSIHTFALMEDDGTWSMEGLPTNVYPSGVSCDSPGSCIAPLDVSSAGENLLVDSEGTWSQETEPLPSNASSSNTGTNLSAVSCPAPSMCFITGSYTDASGNTQGLILSESSGSWQVSEASVPSNATSGAQLQSIACQAAGTCVAFGRYDTNSGEEDLADQLSSGTWTATELPVPSGDTNTETNSAIGCGADSCTVVAPYEDFDAQSLGTAVFTEGPSGWVTSTAPAVAGYGPGAGNGSLSVSCVQDGSCTAVGYFLIYYTHGAYDGGSITQLPAVLPEAPLILAIPGLALLLVGGRVGLEWRRRRSEALT